MTRACLALLVLGGCYTELGMGYSGKGATTVHGTVGFILHLDASGAGERGAVRVGAGAAVGGYAPAGETTQDGTTRPGPVAAGGFARLFGDQDAVVATVDVHAPWGGHIGFMDPDTTETARATRVFAGLGYRHSWRERGPEHDLHDVEPQEREVGAVVVALGHELFWARSTQSAKPSDAEHGAAASVMFTFRGWALARMLDCLLAPDGEACR